MEIQDLLLQKYDYKTMTEIKNLFIVRKQNNEILEKLKQTEQLYNDVIESLLNQTKEKHENVEKINEMFMENSKHLKYILKSLIRSGDL
jgi:3-methyladenine DNA glycosylase AlkC